MAVDEPRRVFLFSGHMIDAPGREVPRFPPEMEPVATRAIADLLAELDGGADDLAVCGGACGGDLIFAEAAIERGVPLELYLPFDAARFVAESVDFADADWRARFVAVTRAAASVQAPPSKRAPRGDPYERNNLRMLDAASRYGPGRLEFICLWNGQDGDGPGGAGHLMREVERRAGRTHWLKTTELWGSGGSR